MIIDKVQQKHTEINYSNTVEAHNKSTLKSSTSVDNTNQRTVAAETNRNAH